MMLQQNIIIAQCNFFVFVVVVFIMNLFKTHCVLIKSFSLKLNVHAYLFAFWIQRG